MRPRRVATTTPGVVTTARPVAASATATNAVMNGLIAGPTVVEARVGFGSTLRRGSTRHVSVAIQMGLLTCSPVRISDETGNGQYVEPVDYRCRVCGRLMPSPSTVKCSTLPSSNSGPEKNRIQEMSHSKERLGSTRSQRQGISGKNPSPNKQHGKVSARIGSASPTWIV